MKALFKAFGKIPDVRKLLTVIKQIKTQIKKLEGRSLRQAA